MEKKIAALDKSLLDLRLKIAEAKQANGYHCVNMQVALHLDKVKVQIEGIFNELSKLETT